MEIQTNNIKLIHYRDSVNKTARWIGDHDLMRCNAILKKGVDKYCNELGFNSRIKMDFTRSMNLMKRKLGNMKVRCGKCGKGMAPACDNNMFSGFFTSNNGNHSVLFKCIFCLEAEDYVFNE